MLYILIILCIVSFMLIHIFDEKSLEKTLESDMKAFKRYSFSATALMITFFMILIVALAGTVYACNSDFLSTVAQKSSIKYQVTDFSAEKSPYNLIGDYETNYTIIVEENLKIEISSKDLGTKVICDNYNPKTVTVEENHYFKWWFLCPYDTYTYTLS